MEEIWKDVPEYEGIYLASNLGNVKSLTRRVNTRGNGTKEQVGKLLTKVVRSTNKYLAVALYKNNKSKLISVHRIIALTFIENTENYPIVMHLDDNRVNNNVCNLRWGTWSENNKGRNQHTAIKK